MNFEAIRDLSVLFVGDAIYDRYVFGKTLGKAIKEPTLSFGAEREEKWPGGVWAAAAHIEGMCKRVDVMHGAEAMVNTRFVDGVYNRKLLTIHERTPVEPSPLADFGAYDLVIVCDFGNGTMTPELIERVSRETRFLAVNAQTNATNMGFNLITKYRRAHYVVLDELEARLAARMKSEPIEDVILALGYRKIVVTLGANGAIGYDGAFHREAASADRIVDTMGAGDAFLAVSAPFAAVQASIADLVRVGNAAGAAKVGVLGHQRSITKEDMKWTT